jgi:acetolactate synthase-1/2/3 large subunit
MGKGAVDERHALSCGVLGALVGQTSLGRHTRELLAKADVILEVGTRNNQNGTDSWRLIPNAAKLIQIDIDPQEIGRNYEALRLVGDAAETLEALAGALSKLDLSRRREARGALETRIAEAWRRFEAARRPLSGRNDGPIRPERLMAELQGLLTPETIVVADASYSSMWIVGQLRSLAPGMRFLTPRGLAGLGWGLPLAIGAKVARPASPVVALVGDGGFAHSWAELETLVRMQVPVTVIVLNNGILGYQRDAEDVKFGTHTTACHFAPVDHAAIARACGAEGLRVEDAKDVRDYLLHAIGSGKPSLIEIMTDPDAHPPLSLYDGTLDRVISSGGKA